MYQPPAPTMPQPASPQPPQRRHTLRNVILLVVGGLVLLGIGAGIGASGPKTTAGSTPASTVTVTASAAPAVTVTVTPSQVTAVKPKPKPKPKAAGPTVLLSLSGSGIENSAPFLVTESQLTVTYSYDCASAGGTGNFIADLQSGNQSSLGSDDQSVANALGAGGTVTTTIYPQNPGTDYHLAVNSECNWTVTVKS